MTRDNEHGHVASETHGNVRVLRIDHPPVNTLSHAVRAGLLTGIEQAAADPAIDAILLIGEGKAFIAGADIREFGKPRQPPLLPDVCDATEACSKPVVAVVHGAALGGGLEVAMAAHYRLALPHAKLGLPEVHLGLLPGAGGTQRAPRLMGAQSAAELMLSGKPLSAQAALDAGLVDRLENSDNPLAAGLAYAQELLNNAAPPRRTRDLAVPGDKADNLAALEALAAETARKTRGLFSPLKIVEAVRAAVELPFEEGLARERALFIECMESPQRQGLIHAFFAEREVLKIPESRAAQPRSVERIGVIGGGTMGAGIAVAALDAGLPVVMIERDAEALARGRANVEKIYAGQLAKGRLSAEAQAEKLARFATHTDYAALAEVDLVIEAVFEDMQVKQDVFRALDAACKPDCVLATNSSYLDIDTIAAATARPQDVIGLHFFSPAHIMKLLEIVVPAQVAPDVVATAFALAQRLKKIPVRAGVCDGFIGNRILAAYKQAADYLMEDGASPYDIDAAVRDFGFAMGPFQVIDLAGGDIGWATRKRRAATRDPRLRYVHIADQLCERGWLGQKTGRGFYRYDQGERRGSPDPEVIALIDAERARKGITPQPFSAEDIMRRYMAAMVNEAAKVVHEGIALRPLDVDVTFINGYGFPRWRGGPMHWADTYGLPRLLADLHTFAQQDPVFWQPAALIEELVARGENFANLNTSK